MGAILLFTVSAGRDQGFGAAGTEGLGPSGGSGTICGREQQLKISNPRSCFEH